MFEEVNLSWEARSGERFQIIASEKPQAGHAQYDLRIDGLSFFALPRPSQLRVFKPDDVASEVSLPSMDEDKTESSTDADLRYESAEVAPQDVDARLATAELAPPLEKSERHDCLEDELTSQLPINNLDSLRHRVTLMIPAIEDLVSRAIVNAFSEDRDSQSSFSSCSFDSLHPAPIHIEASVIWDTMAWMELHVDYAPRPDVEDRKRLFLQKQVDGIFAYVRQEHLTEDAAVRILCNVATILGMELAVPLRKDTVLLHGLNKFVSEEDVLCSLRMFGEISDAAVSQGRRFGICRFRREESATNILTASSSGSFAINGIAPSVTRVEQHEFIRRQPSAVERAQSDPSPTLPIPEMKRTRSHQRNTITIDTAMSAAPFLTVEHVAPLVSPDVSKSILHPNVFANIPARTSSVVFDSPSVLA